MDTVLAYFQGFFSLQDEEEEDRIQEKSHEQEQTRIEDYCVDLEGGSPRDDKIRQPVSFFPPTFSSLIHPPFKNDQLNPPRTMSFLNELFWTHSAPKIGSSDEYDPDLKESSTPASSADEEQHIVHMSHANQSYNSDTNSTQACTDNEGESSKESNERGGTCHRRRLELLHKEQTKQQPHLQWMSHGKFWTLMGILSTWIGFVLAYQTLTSTSFVTLKSPFYIDNVWQDVTDIGLLNLQLCYNNTNISKEGCTIHPLTSKDIEDTMFQTARSVGFLAALLGGFLSVFMTSALCWFSINLRPMTLGYLLAHILQSFTFLFFDSDLCTQHSCSISSGGIMSALASLCWIVSCIATARMDCHKYQKTFDWIQETSFATRSRSRSRSPTKSSHASPSPTTQPAPNLKKKVLERRTTDGTVPLSQDSFGSSSSSCNEMEEVDLENANTTTMETSWRRPGYNRKSSRRRMSHIDADGRLFASNGCEVIRGIQDLKAVEAWAAKSSTISSNLSPPNRHRLSSSSATVRAGSRSSSRQRFDLTVDVHADVNDESEESRMSSTCVGSPIQPSRRNELSSIRRAKASTSPWGSPAARSDRSGDSRRASCTTSPTNFYRHTSLSRASACKSPSNKNNNGSSRNGSPTSQGAVMVAADPVMKDQHRSKASRPPSSATRRQRDVQRELEELDTLVQLAIPRNQGGFFFGGSSPSSTSSSSSSCTSLAAASVAARIADSDIRNKGQHSPRISNQHGTAAASPTNTTPRRSVVFAFSEEAEDQRMGKRRNNNNCRTIHNTTSKSITSGSFGRAKAYRTPPPSPR